MLNAGEIDTREAIKAGSDSIVGGVELFQAVSDCLLFVKRTRCRMAMNDASYIPAKGKSNLPRVSGPIRSCAQLQ
jgi:hypothetical protein